MTLSLPDLMEIGTAPVAGLHPDILSDIKTIERIAAIGKILEVVCKTTSMGFAAVARVTDTHWVACAVRDEISFGLAPGGELDLETTLCNEIRCSGKAIAIDSVQHDEVYRRHHTPARYGFQSYISVPIYRTNGAFFGTLCAIDPKPAKLKNPQIEEMFAQFAILVSFYLDAEERLVESKLQIETQREDAKLREQFVAVLAHDLRNPLAAIQAGARLLKKEPLSDKSAAIVNLVQESVQRMSGLINDVTDFARTRLGNGFQLIKQPDLPLAPVLEQVIDELRATYPERYIETRFALTGPVHCDHARVGQLVSNLAANAIKHGAQDSPIQVSAQTDAGTLELVVSNQGVPIPAAAIERLFQPFFRAGQQSDEQALGLGLGLYIASEIVSGHNGTITVDSNERETRFTVRIPMT